MNKFLLVIFIIAGLVNLFAFVADGYDLDKLVIAVLFGVIALNQYTEVKYPRGVKR